MIVKIGVVHLNGNYPDLTYQKNNGSHKSDSGDKFYHAIFATKWKKAMSDGCRLLEKHWISEVNYFVVTGAKRDMQRYLISPVVPDILLQN